MISTVSTSQKITTAEDFPVMQHNISIKDQVLCDLLNRSATVPVESDKEFETMVSDRLSKLDELSRNEFYRGRMTNGKIGALPQKDLDLLILEALERSYKHQNQ